MINTVCRPRLNPLLTVAVLLALATVALSVHAGEEGEEWRPPAPVPDTYDWVQLTSGEWLKGEVVALYEDRLEFDSDKLKLQSLKWNDVQQLLPARTMEVAFEDGEVLVGKILVDQDSIRFLGDEERQLPRSEILSITSGSPREIDNWAVKASFGLNLRSGNSEQAEVTTRAIFIRRGAKNRVNLEYLAFFNEIEGVTMADNQRATSGWNHYVSRRVFWTPLFGEWFRDPFQNISARWTVGAGVGYELIDTSRITMKVEAGLSYQETHFDSVGEGEATTASTPGLVFSTAYEHEVTGWLDFNFEWRFNLVNEDSGTYTHHMLTGLEFEITKILDLDITLIWDRIKDPHADSEGVMPEQDDYRLVTSFGFEF